MAKIHEEVIVIKLSKLVKDDAVSDIIASDETVLALEQVVQELAGPGVVVEVQTA